MKNDLYFDYCATTPLNNSVREAMLPSLENTFGNPSSMHFFGQKARDLVETARKNVANGIGASPKEIIFTSGATEATNLGIIGCMNALSKDKNHLIISSIEHHAGLHTAEALEKTGFEVSYLPVNSDGLVSLESVEMAIRPETGLISVMMVNNEMGAIQDIKGIGEIAKRNNIIFITDVVQAVNCFEIDVDDMNIDLLSISAHKIYGPKGIGALYVREGIEIVSVMYGGTQEYKLRPGTENVPGIVGLGAAMEIRNKEFIQRYSKNVILRNFILDGIYEFFPNAIINGQLGNIAPHIVSVSFPNVDGELLLYHLSKRGIAVSMGSACTADEIQPSHVLTSMGIPIKNIEGTLRISFGEPTTEGEILSLLEELRVVIKLAKLT